MNYLDCAVVGAEWLYKNSFALPEPDYVFSISQYLADIMTNPNDEQHVVLTISSRSGRGKSYVGIAIAEALAVELAKRKGGEPRDYFNAKHISIMDKKKTMRLIAERSRFPSQILVVDEGLENFNRRAMSKENVLSVEYAAIAREYRMCMIRHVQIRKMLDPGVLEQSTHEATISRAVHLKGYNEIKFKIKVDKDAQNEAWGVFPVSSDGYTKVARCRIPAPSPEILKEYKLLKRGATDDFVSNMFDAIINDTELAKQKGITKRDDVDVRCQAAWQYHLDDEKLSMNKCTEMANVSRETFTRWLSRNKKARWYATAKQK